MKYPRLLPAALMLVLAITGCVPLGLRVEAPVITPDEGAYPAVTVRVRIACATAGAAVHYTTDGTRPTPVSPVYDGEIALTATATVKAIATVDGKMDSAAVTAAYTLSKSGFTVAGRVLYGDGVLHETTDVGGQYFQVADTQSDWILNTRLGVNTNDVLFYYDPVTSEYAFTNLPDEPLQFGILFDNVTGDHPFLPGNFACWDTTYLATPMPAEDLLLDVRAIQHLRLLTPYDNSTQEAAGAIPEYASPVNATWAEIPGAASYEYYVLTVPDTGTRPVPPPTAIGVTDLGAETEATLTALPPSAAGEHYELYIVARDAAGNALCDLAVAVDDGTDRFGLWFKIG